MYAAMVDYRVETGRFDEAVTFWRGRVEPVSAGQPGFEGSLLLAEPEKGRMVGIGLWSSKAHADEFAATGPWREGSELRRAFAEYLSAEPSREELEVVHLGVSAAAGPASQ